MRASVVRHVVTGSVVLLLAAALAHSPSVARAADAPKPTTQPTSSVTGIVTAESEVPLSEMVVYLESPDPNRPMPPAPPPAKVSQKNAKFDPPLTVVTIGQAVNFPNDEDKPIDHNVFSTSPAKRFDLGLYGPGKEKTVTFDKPGPVFLFCSIHRYMDGVVFVSPTPYTSRVDSKTGRYEIKNVPPGQWTLKTWQRRRRFPEMTIPTDVPASKSATVDFELKKKK
jgi:plastocyanin